MESRVAFRTSSSSSCAWVRSSPTNSFKVSTKLAVVLRSTPGKLSLVERFSRNVVELSAFLSLERRTRCFQWLVLDTHVFINNRSSNYPSLTDWSIYWNNRFCTNEEPDQPVWLVAKSPETWSTGKFRERGHFYNWHLREHETPGRAPPYV